MQTPGGHRAGRSQERGSQMVEMSLALVPFMACVLLVMDVALAIFCKASLQYAVREGVRYAVTGQTLTGKGQDFSIQSVVQQNAMGFLAGSAGIAKIAIRYYTPDTLTATASNAGGNIVEISVEGFGWNPLTSLLHSGDPITMTVRSSDRMESSPNGVPPAR